MRTKTFAAVSVVALVWGLWSHAFAAEKIRVACVGDSITYGAGVENRDQNNYPRVLGNLLGEKYEVKNFGVSGATLLKKGDKPYWKLNEFKAVDDFAPNIIIVKLGTNDTKPQNWAHKDEFAADYAAMLDHFKSLPSKPKIYACLPVPVYEDKWGITEKTVKEEVIPIVKKVAKEKGATVIDLYKALGGHKEMFPDGVHPNAAGAAVLAKSVHEALKK